MSKRAHTRLPRLPRRWAIYLFLALIGATTGWVLLEHVIVKNRIVNLGHKQREVEREIATLDGDIRSLNLRIEESLSRKNLQDTLARRRTRLRPIQAGAPVIISAASRPTK
jgi:hypothetical protein